MEIRLAEDGLGQYQRTGPPTRSCSCGKYEGLPLRYHLISDSSTALFLTAINLPNLPAQATQLFMLLQQTFLGSNRPPPTNQRQTFKQVIACLIYPRACSFSPGVLSFCLRESSKSLQILRPSSESRYFSIDIQHCRLQNG